MRLATGQPVDAGIVIADALQTQIHLGHFRADTRVDLAVSRTGLAVRRGASAPDIRTIEGMRRSLLEARSVAVSNGVSGAYIVDTLLPLLGIDDHVARKTVIVKAPELVGQALPRNDAEVGMQQISELLAVPGIQVVGPLPEALQCPNVIAAAVSADARHPGAAVAWIAYLGTTRVAQRLRQAGFDPK